MPPDYFNKQIGVFFQLCLTDAVDHAHLFARFRLEVNHVDEASVGENHKRRHLMLFGKPSTNLT